MHDAGNELEYTDEKTITARANRGVRNTNTLLEARSRLGSHQLEELSVVTNVVRRIVDLACQDEEHRRRRMAVLDRPRPRREDQPEGGRIKDELLTRAAIVDRDPDGAAG